MATREKRFVSDYPDLMQQWDWDKNGDLEPAKITYGSERKVWWKCLANNHCWELSVKNRMKSKSLCPFCDNKRVSNTNNLSITHPHLILEWGPTNKKKINEYMPKSNCKIEWICSTNSTHIWFAEISKRTDQKPTGCPYCCNKYTSIENSLGALYPQIADEWSKNNKTQAYEYTPGSDYQAEWICKKNKTHIWKAIIGDRTRGTGCPYCCGNLPSTENNLAIHYPFLSKEWSKNNKRSPFEYLPWSNFNAEWCCSQNSSHIWKTNISTRVRFSTGCPHCNMSGGEYRIANILNHNTITYSYNIPMKNCRHINLLRFDFYIEIENKKYAIEYDGVQHRKPVEKWGGEENLKGIQKRDSIKNKYCADNNIFLLRIPDNKKYTDVELEGEILTFLNIGKTRVKKTS